MTHTRKLLTAAAGLVGIGLLVLVLAAPRMQRSFFYPNPKALPPVVTNTTESLLLRLQLSLETNAPIVARALQPGLSDERIAALEKEGGFELSDDLKALYRWHNGISGHSMLGLLPECRFTPLDEIVSEQAVLRRQVSSATVLQRIVMAAFGNHRKNWVSVFDDGAGDGYFYDPQRTDAEGAFFYHFAEVGYYVWFPSFRNFLAAAIEGHETGVFNVSADGESLDQDYDRADELWKQFAEVSEE